MYVRGDVPVQPDDPHMAAAGTVGTGILVEPHDDRGRTGRRESDERVGVGQVECRRAVGPPLTKRSTPTRAGTDQRST